MAALRRFMYDAGMKQKTLQEHMKSIAAIGGKALIQKRGKKYMRKLAKKRWQTKAPEKGDSV